MSSSSSSPVIHAAVLGTGLSATVFHLPFLSLSPSFSVVSILSRKNSEALHVAYPSAQQFGNLDDLLSKSGQLDLVVIATPPETHFPYAKAALEAGKHVIIEKPLCPTSQEAQELISIATRQGKVLAVYQNRRFDSDFLTVAKVIKSGKLGHVVEYEAHYDRFRPALKDGGATWKEDADLPGSGLLFDLGSHLIDQALFLFGIPQSVTASIFKQRPNTRIDDCFHVVLHYPHMTASLKAGMLIAANRPRFALFGTQGSFVKFGLDVQEPQLRAGMKLTDPAYGIEPTEDEGILNWVNEKGEVTKERIQTLPGDYRQYYDHVARAINTGVEPPVTGESVRNVIRVIELAYQSNKEQRTIPWN